MSVGSVSQQDVRESINKVLAPFRRYVVSAAIGHYCMMALAIMLLVFFILFWADTVWPMSSTVRWIASRGAVLVTGLILFLYSFLRAYQTTNSTIARKLDRQLSTGGEVLAGLQLATTSINDKHELTQGLAKIATLRAADKVRGISPNSITDWKSIQHAFLALSACAVVGACIAIAVPSIAWNQFQRFLYPSSDIPPYTGVLIELELEKSTVVYGSDAFAKATIQAGKVDRVQLVVRTDTGSEQSLPMLAQNDSTYQAVLTRVTEPLTIYARSGNSRSLTRRIEVQLTPKILPPKVQITPPAYTRAATYKGLIPERGIAGLAGTVVDWEVTSNRPLSKGLLRVVDRDGSEERIELKPTATGELATTVVGILTLTKNATFELSVHDVDGMESQENVTGNISILEDRRPVVRITQPRQISLATPDVDLSVVVLADDDYGITSLRLFRSLNGSPSTPVDAIVGQGSRAEGNWVLPLPQFGLSEGDEIQLFARTEDNDPAGPKGAESAITKIQIISVARFQEMMIQQQGAKSIQAKYQAARRYFEQLDNALREIEEAQKELESNPSPETAKKLQEKIDAAQEAASQAAKQIQKLSERPLDVDIDQALAKDLAEMAKQAAEMQKLLEDTQPGTQGLSDQDKKRIEEMRKQTGNMEKDLQQNAIDPLNSMQSMMPLIADQSAFTRLVEQQRDLAERLKGLETADANDPTTARRIADLEAEQEQLKQSLNQLLDNIEKHANDLIENEDSKELKSTALEFVEAVRNSQASAEMSSTQETMLRDQFRESQQHADSAAKILESFLSDCQSMGDKACNNCKAKFNPSKFGNSLSQMLQKMGNMPGSSGMKAGQSPGMSLGWGEGGGYSMRMNGPENVGMYGSLPMPEASSSSGKGDRESSGIASSHQIADNGGSEGKAITQEQGQATGQSINSVPSSYRSKVSEYFRALNEQLNQSDL